jgi:hypothetical protein
MFNKISIEREGFTPGATAATIGGGLLGGGAIAAEVANRGQGAITNAAKSVKDIAGEIASQKFRTLGGIENLQQSIHDGTATLDDISSKIHQSHIDRAAAGRDIGAESKKIFEMGNKHLDRTVQGSAYTNVNELSDLHRKHLAKSLALNNTQHSIPGRMAAVAERLGLTNNPKLLRRLAVGGGVGALGLTGLGAYLASRPKPKEPSMMDKVKGMLSNILPAKPQEQTTPSIKSAYDRGMERGVAFAREKVASLLLEYAPELSEEQAKTASYAATTPNPQQMYQQQSQPHLYRPPQAQQSQQMLTPPPEPYNPYNPLAGGPGTSNPIALAGQVAGLGLAGKGIYHLGKSEQASRAFNEAAKARGFANPVDLRNQLSSHAAAGTLKQTAPGRAVVLTKNMAARSMHLGRAARFGGLGLGIYGLSRVFGGAKSPSVVAENAGQRYIPPQAYVSAAQGLQQGMGY